MVNSVPWDDSPAVGERAAADALVLAGVVLVLEAGGEGVLGGDLKVELEVDVPAGLRLELDEVVAVAVGDLVDRATGDGSGGADDAGGLAGGVDGGRIDDAVVLDDAIGAAAR